MIDVLDQRTLNRTTLARQHLLARTRDTPLDVVAHLVGLQAQVPTDPYTALWSRIEGFDPMVVSDAIEARLLVRLVVMRGTIHLVTAADALALRAHVQPVLDYEMTIHSEFKAPLAGLDLTPVIAFARPLLTSSALTPAEIRAAMADEFPSLDAGALAFACRNNLALVQVPPRGLWGRGGAVRTMTTEGWLGGAPEPITPEGARHIVGRYLRAFGPASVRDLVAWSRVDALGAAMESMAGELRPYRNERGVELYDVPEGEIIDPDAPAPVRFLPEYDNVLLSHRDRSRFGGDDRRAALGSASAVKGTVLVDGIVSAAWHVTRDPDARPKPTAPATLTVEFVPPLTKKLLAAVEREGSTMLRFLVPSAVAHQVRLVAL